MPACTGCNKAADRSVLVIGDTKFPYCNDCIKAWELIIKTPKILTPIKGKRQGKIRIIRFDKDTKNK